MKSEDISSRPRQSEIEARTGRGPQACCSRRILREGAYSRRDAQKHRLGKSRVAVRSQSRLRAQSSSGMKMMQAGQEAIGVDAEQVARLLAEIGPDWDSDEGFSLFRGSQNLMDEAIVGSEQRKSSSSQ